jgi:hypothetical protein
MKKNIKLTTALVPLLLATPTLLLCMDQFTEKKRRDPAASPIDQSIIITPMPTTRGLGFVRSALDWVRNEEENIYSDLLNKTFDPNNTSYHRKLDSTIEAFTTKRNDLRLTETLALCRNEYHGKVKIGDIPARMAHVFLVQKSKDEQKTLKEKIEAKDKFFIEKQNILIAALQKSFNEQLVIINQNLIEHIKNNTDDIQKDNDEIRRLKTGLIHIHKLNKTFSLSTEDYCSDDELDPEEVKNFYSDTCLLEKIKVDQSMNETTTKTAQTLANLSSLNASIQRIPQLKY